MSQQRQLTQENSQFSLDVVPQFSMTPGEGGAKAKRTFSGVAYSGGMIENHWYWGQLVFDLESMSVPAKLPALIDHDRAQRAGYVTTSNVDINTGLTVTGNLLSNQAGSQVASDSDEGFPWQMSVHITPNSVEEVAQGASVVVNGKTLTGPVTIFRNTKITEVSFTATGWDSNTTATALSKKPSGEQSTQFNKEQPMTEQEKADFDKLKADNLALTAANEELTKKFSNIVAEKRTADIKQLFSETGQEFKADAEEVLAFSKMDDASFAATSAALKAQFSKLNKLTAGAGSNLFSHQANSEGHGSGLDASQESPLVANAKERAKK